MKRLIIAAAATAALAVPAVPTAAPATADAHKGGTLPVWTSKNGKRCHKHTRKVWHKSHGRAMQVHCKTPRKRSSSSRASSAGAWVLPRRVVMCESGGNARAVNYSNPRRPAGLYQIITSTWRAYGGASYAPTADRASVSAQGVVAKRILRGQGARAWACW